MDDILTVQVVDAKTGLEKVYEGVTFRELTFFSKQVKQRASTRILHDEIHVVVVFEVVVQLDDVGIVQFSLDFDLSH